MQPAGLGFVIDVFIFYLSGLELVKVISVHRAHRLLSEATLILCYVEEQAFGDRQWFRPASERQRYQHTGETTLASSHKRPLSRLPVSPIIIERLRLLSVPEFARCSPTLGFARTRNGQSFAKYAPSAFTDEVNYIIDNEKQKALRLAGVRSARACVIMPSAAN